MDDNARKTDFNFLIPELRLWNEGAGIDIDDWLTCVGNYEHAVAYGNLFWPEFTIHDDCVLFAGFNEESYRGFLDQAQGDKKSVEIVMNHLHILDLFSNESEGTAENLIVFLGGLLKDVWACKLARDFPNRNIVVDFAAEGKGSLLNYEITFFQERD